MSFKTLNLIPEVLKALEQEGYTEPTPIQEKAIPHILRGSDLLGCARTGTGKTAAFAIPIIQNLSNSKTAERTPAIKCLILTPTRELAIQIGESFAAYGRHTKLSHTVIFGGVNQNAQTRLLRNGVDILIATPGRLLDLMQQGFVKLNAIEIFVLDEADRMLDMGFIHDVKKTVAALPKNRQTLFFSATMPPEIGKLADQILSNAVRVEAAPVSSAAETVKQLLYYVEKENKMNLLMHLLNDSDKGSVLVFTRTKHGADKVCKMLNKNGVSSAAIHGNKAQNARQNALNNFKSGKIRVLVATDIAARGIDVDKLELVINYEIPNIAETYVHRIGRTGRAGNTGVAVSFCEREERAYIRDIEKLTAARIEVVQTHPFNSFTPSDNTRPAQARPEQRSGKPYSGSRSNAQRSHSSKPSGSFNHRHKSNSERRTQQQRPASSQA